MCAHTYTHIHTLLMKCGAACAFLFSSSHHDLSSSLFRVPTWEGPVALGTPPYSPLMTSISYSGFGILSFPFTSEEFWCYGAQVTQSWAESLAFLILTSVPLGSLLSGPGNHLHGVPFFSSPPCPLFIGNDVNKLYRGIFVHLIYW